MGDGKLYTNNVLNFHFDYWIMVRIWSIQFTIDVLLYAHVQNRACKHKMCDKTWGRKRSEMKSNNGIYFAFYISQVPEKR